MLKTRLCKLLGIEFPIFSAPMGPDIAGPDLAAAVSGAGGLGLMQAQFSPPADFREQIQRVRKATDKPFGVNFILALPHEENLAVCLEEHVPVISFFWGDAARYVERVHAAGSKVFLQVGSVEAAQRADDYGVDVIIVQGSEAGGHVEGEVAGNANRGCGNPTSRCRSWRYRGCARSGRRLGARRGSRSAGNPFPGDARIERAVVSGV